MRKSPGNGFFHIFLSSGQIRAQQRHVLGSTHQQSIVVSLNDMIHYGPKLQNELFDVLIRFRRNNVAIVCDCAEMYLKIKFPQEDRPYQQFLWRDVKPEGKPDVYEFSSAVFGIYSSPFQAQFVAQTHAETNRETYPMAAETVLKSTDDNMDSV
ncbi:uncharacterized protein [Magallana gigas]|uniref:uncharacterized protein n=1 Tax=Magallana gigas TaxID=29159 RepID=UPI003342CBCF